MRPEQPCGNRPPGPPGFGQAEHGTRIGSFRELEKFRCRGLESQVPGRPGIRSAKTGERIYVGSPRTYAGKCDQRPDDLVIGMEMQHIEPELAFMGGSRQSVESAALGAGQAQLHEGRVPSS